MTISEKKLTAILPVRMGSQRIPNKNFRPFCGSSLFEMKLQRLASLDFLDEVIVSSDSAEALEIAERHGVKTHLRDNYYASSKCTNSEFFLRFLNITDADYIMYSPCTSPLITEDSYQRIINSFYDIGDQYDSIATVKMVKEHMWLEGKPLNYNPANSPNSQDLPEIYSLTYGVNIISREALEKNKNIIGQRPKFYILDGIESIDIDNMEEFEMAEYFYKKLLK